MEYVFLGITYFIGQACCWYHFYDCCGCINNPMSRHYDDREPERPLPPPAAKERNPFKDPTIPKDEHLQCAYS